MNDAAFDDDLDDLLSGLDTSTEALGLLTTPSSFTTTPDTTRSNPSSSILTLFADKSDGERECYARGNGGEGSDGPSIMARTVQGSLPSEWLTTNRDEFNRRYRNASPQSQRNFHGNSKHKSTLSESVFPPRSRGTVRTLSSGEHVLPLTPSTNESLQLRNGVFTAPPPKLPRKSTTQTKAIGLYESASYSSGFHTTTSTNNSGASTPNQSMYRFLTPTVSSAICRRQGVVPAPCPLDRYRDARDEREFGLTTASSNSCGIDTRRKQNIGQSEPLRSALDEEMAADLANANEDTSDLDAENSSEIHAAVLLSGGKIGLAYYDTGTQVLHMMKDFVEGGEFLLLKNVMTRIGCRSIITSGKTDDKFLNSLHRSLNPDCNTNETWQEGKSVELLPNADFDLEAAKRRLMNHSHFIPDDFNYTERAIRLSALIPFESVCMVRCAGALVKYLNRKRIGVNLHEGDGGTRILGVQVFSLESTLYLDDTSYRALDIFRPEVSAFSRYQNKTSYKEQGLSLLGMMNRCRSYIGWKLLKNWFQNPVRDRAVLTERLDAVSTLMDTGHADTVVCMRRGVRGVNSVAPILKRMSQNQINIRDWKCLHNSICNAHIIGEAVRSSDLTGGVFTKIREQFGNEVAQMKRLIDEIIDFDEFALKGRFSVRTTVDEELDEKKRNYNGLPALMTDIAQEELAVLPPEVEQCSVNYMPQIGYLLCIPFTRSMAESSSFEIEGLTFQFQNKEVAHYKNAKMQRLDYVLGDLMCDIIDHENHIMHKLQGKFLTMSNVLHQVVLLISELDCLLSFASCAQEFGWVRPQFTDDNVIEIIEGRHPIMERRIDQFVANDYRSALPDGKVKVITGPNISGKSVYLKQVALIVYMSHLGSFVPAESSLIGPVDNIFTCIWSLESVSTGISSFMVDVNMISRACRESTEKSLVIVDEFGKGTEMADGLALLTSTIRSFTDRGHESPHVMFSTHFHEIAQRHLLPTTSLIKYQMMNVEEMAQEMVFLYKLIPGSAKFSHAIHVAARMGLSERVIQGAMEVTEHLLAHTNIYASETDREKSLYTQAQNNVRQFLNLDLENDEDVESFLERLKQARSPTVNIMESSSGSESESDFIY